MKEKRVLYALGSVSDKFVEEMYAPNGAKKKRVSHHPVKKMWLIAAVITATVFLMGSAIAALVAINVDNVKIRTASGEIHEGEKVEFEKVQDTFIELGSYYPQEIPDGYTMTFISEGSPLQNQKIEYENEAGNYIRYWIYVGDPASDVEIYDIVSKTDVDVNGHDGILYKQEGGRRALVWIHEDQGYGFALRTDDATVDLLAMAKSTAEGKTLVPTRSESTIKAVEELGDYHPAYLPEGYEEQGTMGSPLAEGSGWYSYVRKWFVNKAENNQIYFEYETYRIATEDGYTDDAKTICSFFIPGCNILTDEIAGEEVEINGMFGLAAKNHIAWADPETHVVYHLYSEDVTADELLKVAQSIIKNP